MHFFTATLTHCGRFSSERAARDVHTHKKKPWRSPHLCPQCIESEWRCLLSYSRTAARVRTVSVHTNAARGPPSPESQASSRTRPVTRTMRRPLMKGLLRIYSDAGAGNAVPGSPDARGLNTDRKL